MRFRSVAILVPSVTFVVTFGISSWQHGWWHRPTSSLPATSPAPAREHSAAASPSTAVLAPADASRRAGTTPVQLATTVAQSEGANAGGARTNERPADAVLQALPVRVTLERNADQTGITARLRNTSPDPLHVTVHASNSMTGQESMAELDVAPDATIDLSSAGLQVQHGDTLTLSNPSYQDRSVHAS